MICFSSLMQYCYRQEGGYLLCCNTLSDSFALFIILYLSFICLSSPLDAMLELTEGFFIFFTG